MEWSTLRGGRAPAPRGLAMGALGKARGLLGRGDYAGAAAALEGCEGLKERALLAQARAGQKDYVEALRVFEDVRDREGSRKSVLTQEQWHAMGQAAEHLGQPREAAADIRTPTGGSPRKPASITRSEAFPPAPRMGPNV